MRPTRPLLGPSLAAAVLGGCMVGPTYRASPPGVGTRFSGADPTAAAAPLSRPVSRSADLAAWWRTFGDAELDSLIDRALASNLDRFTAASRIRQARQSATETRAGLFPSLNGSTSGSHTRISDNAGFSSFSSLFSGGGGAGAGATGAGGASGVASAGTPSVSFDTYDVGLNANYDLDLFGGARRAVRASRARVEAQVWSGRDTDVTVTSEVARAYLQLRSDQARLAIVKAAARSQSDLLKLIAARFGGGLTTNVDVVQQRSQLSTTLAMVAPLEASIEAGAHQVAFLLGEAPDALGSELAPKADPLAALPRTPPEVPVGLPSDLLKRRPDVRQAERALAASVEDVGQATAALYPSVSLTGSFDFVSTDLKHLLDAASRNYIYAAQLTAPLFDAGRLRARRHQAEETAIQAGVAYRKAALTGLQQTADALSTYAADQRRLQILQAGYADAERAVVLTKAQYFGGLQDLQGALRAQATALTTQDQLIQTQAALSTDLVSLFRALGGGWSPAHDPDRLLPPADWTGTQRPLTREKTATTGQVVNSRPHASLDATKRSVPRSSSDVRPPAAPSTDVPSA